MGERIMVSNVNEATFKILLRKRVIVADNLIFEAERELDLPCQPFVGLRLYNTEWSAPGCDESEDEIEEIAYDLRTGRFLCYLPIDDWRRESSGSADWTEKNVRQSYREWKLELDRPTGVATTNE